MSAVTARAVARAASRVASTAVALACIAVAVVPLYGNLTESYRLQPVLSGSMQPLLSRGDLAWVEPRPRTELNVGDVLVFNSPRRGSTPSRRVIHRVIELVDPATIRSSQALDNATYIRTQGDNNPDPDPWIAAITDEEVWVQTRAVPNAAWPVLFAGDTDPRVFILLGSGVGLVGFAVSTLRSALRDKTTTRRRDATRGWRARAPVFAFDAAISRNASRAVLFSALVLGSAGLAAAVTGSFTDTETSAAQLRSGAVSLAASETTIAVSDLLPGEEVGRVVDLRNDGTLALGFLQVDVRATGDAALLTPTGGLQIRIERCPVAWTTETMCSAPMTVVVDSRPLVGRTNLDLSTLAVAAPGGVDHLRVVLRLPDAAPLEAAARSATATVAFVTGQRPGLVR